ncbi:translation initiation factor IF-2, putative [Plasmodium gallinaceum]|uniref:Translation initiation factor IF-2, putative n=1 Tax=Plasmodium gallinaceum TaxID=5849 RepID=A0A1J1GZ52_PLAGA|nr:translation initiation factor IF-2, putative [Plasmodium gallinaceum]CRG97513.1 translation initiation factor IF-2, putative [Plasmodium gallinaceum]
MIYFCTKLLYKGKYIPVGRRIYRETLIKGRKQKSPIILLPPYISIHELRLMLNINYETCFKAANVYKNGNKYTWKDSDDRIFQTVNKRNVIIPYSVAAYVSKIFKFKPKLIEVELLCEEENRHEMVLKDIYKKTYSMERYYESKLKQHSNVKTSQKTNINSICNKNNLNKSFIKDDIHNEHIFSLLPNEYSKTFGEKKNYYTVISVIGHINHGKTTLLDKITNNNLALNEAGCITQNIKPIHFEQGTFKFTFLDTPGHKVFQIFRGRAAFLSDILIILISLEVGAEIQTEEAIKYADKFNIPVIFALNKVDLYKENESIVKAELKNQCRKMYDEGNLKHNFSSEIDNSISISSLTGYNLNKLINRIFFISQNINIPYHNVNDFYNNYDSIKKSYTLNYNSNSCQENIKDKTKKEMNNYDTSLLQKYIRKSDFLLALDKKPFGMGIVVDISKDSSKGTILNVIVRNGFFIEGNYFICGSAYGKIQKMYKFNSNFKEYCTYASIGMAVQISGIKKYGNATTDDLIFTLPQNNAFRLCQYRLMVEKLSTLQVSGKEIKVSWENDMKKNEFHGEGIYENRMEMSDKRKAIEEFGVENEKIFNDVSVEEFHKSNTQLRKEENESIEIELEENYKNDNLKHNKKKKLESILSEDDNSGSILIPEDNTFLFLKDSKTNEEFNEDYNLSKFTKHKDSNIIQEFYNCNQIENTKNYKDNDYIKNDSRNLMNINSLDHNESKFKNNSYININDNYMDKNNNSKNDVEDNYDHWETNNHYLQNKKNHEDVNNYESNNILEKEDKKEIKKEEEKNKESIYTKCTNIPFKEKLSITVRGRKNKYRKGLRTFDDTSAINESPENPTYENDNENSRKLNEPWYYEESEESWTKKVLQRNNELMERWRNKTKQREIEKERQIFYEKQMILKNEIMKRNLLGEEKLTEEEINAYLYDKKSTKGASVDTQANEEIKLPKKNRPVIPIIIRTNYVGMFDIFLDEFENIQNKYNVKISIVHGGIGPITPNDVVHAEVESNYGYCCIYAFQVKVLPDAVKQAVLSNIVIKQFDVFTDLVDDVVKRIKNIKSLITHNMYVRSLKSEKSQEGI